MFDDDDAVAAVDQGLENGEEAFDVVAVEAGGGFVEEEQRARGGRERSARSRGLGVGRSGVGAEVADEFEALGFAAAEGVEGLAEREVAEADGFEGGEAGADGRMVGEKREGVGDGRGEQVGDGAVVPADREDLGFETAAFADGARDENVGEKLHLDAFIAEPETVVATAVATVEGKGGGAEAGGLRGGGGGVEVADQVPGFGVERGVRARGAGEGGLVDEEDFGKRSVRRQRGNGGDGGGVFGELEALREEALVDDVVEQGGFAGAGDAAEANETVQGEAKREVAQIVLRGAGELEGRVAGWNGAAGGGGGDRLAAGEVGAGDAGGRSEEGGDRALENDVAAAAAGLGADFDDVIGGADHGLVVFHDDDGVPGVGEGADDRDEAVDVARVQADAGFIEDEERVDQRGAEAGGEVDALDFAAGEGFGLAVEGQVREADLGEVAQPGADGVEREIRGVRGSGGRPRTGGPMTEEGQEFGDGQLVELGERAVLPFPAEGFGLEAQAAAGRAGVVGAVAGEEDAHVHLVGALLEPAEEALHAIPILRPGLAVFLAVAGFAVDHEALLLGRERGERDVGRDFLLLGENVEVFFGLAVDFALPALDGAVVEGEGLVGDGEAVVDVDHAAEAAALRAGAEGGVERKERGRGGAERAAGRGRVEAAGEMAGGREGRSAGSGGLGVEEKNLALAEVEGGFGRLEETGLVRRGEGEAVLNDEDEG